jgi:hypothetical protein
MYCYMSQISCPSIAYVVTKNLPKSETMCCLLVFKVGDC